jgi:hypothetical protein
MKENEKILFVSLCVSLFFMVSVYVVRFFYKSGKAFVFKEVLGRKDKTNEAVLVALARFEKRLDEIEQTLIHLPPVCGEGYLGAKSHFDVQSHRPRH